MFSPEIVQLLRNIKTNANVTKIDLDKAGQINVTIKDEQGEQYLTIADSSPF